MTTSLPNYVLATVAAFFVLVAVGSILCNYALWRMGKRIVQGQPALTQTLGFFQIPQIWKRYSALEPNGTYKRLFINVTALPLIGLIGCSAILCAFPIPPTVTR